MIYTKPYHDIHKNSKEGLSITPRIDRKVLILSVYRQTGQSMTDRQIMRILGYSEPNMVRPRITELIREGKLVEVGKIIKNGRTVRLTALPCSVGEQMTLGM